MGGGSRSRSGSGNDQGQVGAGSIEVVARPGDQAADVEDRGGALVPAHGAGALLDPPPDRPLRGVVGPIEHLVAGAEEELIKPDQPSRMAEPIPGAELVITPGTGHFALYAQPAEFNRAVLDFLATGQG